MLCDELRGYANPLAKISRMMRSGELTPLIKGLYETDAAVPGHYLAGIIYGPSYLSFEFALAWHGLIPEAVYSYTSATCGKGRKKRRRERPDHVDSHDPVRPARSPYGADKSEQDRHRKKPDHRHQCIVLQEFHSGLHFPKEF